MAKSVFKAIGIMSGTSLDGVDLAACTFTKVRGKWSYAFEKTTTIPYNKHWKSALSAAHLLSGARGFGIPVTDLLGDGIRRHRRPRGSVMNVWSWLYVPIRPVPGLQAT